MLLSDHRKTAHVRTSSLISMSKEPLPPVMASTACKECGCVCETCSTAIRNYGNSSSLDLHQQIEELQSQLRRSTAHISQIEHELIENKETAECEVWKRDEDLIRLRERYDRLLESHKRMQRVNHDLEDKLLKVVNKFESEKTSLQRDLANITSQLVEARVLVCELEEENEKYRTDCNYAVQLLQCKPSNFVAHKLTALPVELQERVKKHMTREQLLELEGGGVPSKETKLIRVPMPTFPPTAMVYSINDLQKDVEAPPLPSNGTAADTVPVALIAQVLAQPENRRHPHRTYICMKCKSDIFLTDKSLQTSLSSKDMKERSSSGQVGVHRPRTNSTETEI